MNTRTPVIYIAGPFRAPDAWGVEQNVHAAERWILPVAKAGAIPLCPHAMYRHFDGTLDDDYWLNATLGLLRLCDGIITIPGWRSSKGTLDEIELAKQLWIPRYTVSVEWERDEAAVDMAMKNVSAWIHGLGNSNDSP